MRKTKLATLAAAMVLAGCASLMSEHPDLTAQARAMMKASFKEHGQAKLDRIDQDDVQQTCSRYHGDVEVPKDVAARIQSAGLATIRYPADGQYLGDWKNGEKIAQTGVGLQYSDDPKQPSGGNCYACHELTQAEVSFGTIGPSLRRFGKVRGFTAEMQKYAYGKVYNADAFSACTNMPRFGHKHILTEQQVKDVVALLMDPQSPVNQ